MTQNTEEKGFFLLSNSKIWFKATTTKYQILYK